MKKFSSLRFKFNVGMKVAATVVFFEVLMIVAYTILTNLVVDEQAFMRFLNMSQQNFIIIVLISSLVLAGYLTFMVITRIFNPVSSLITGTEEIIRGNLDLKLNVKTNDELQLLAERFNAMAAALKVERQSLENKVKERTRELEESQAKENVRQKEVLHLKDEFLFVAAHELRTPVTSIRWSLESVAGSKMSVQVKDAFSDALTASASLSSLVEDLLNMARIDSGRIPFKNEFVNVLASANAALEELKPMAEKRSIKVTLDVPEGLVGMAMADNRRVGEVMTNLLVNAVKFNREGGSVILKIRDENGWVRFDVEDDGPGIPLDEQQHLFEKFWRSKSQTGVEGSGLGLFITKRLVDGMNGSISFASRPGKSTTFTVKLPKAKS